MENTLYRLSCHGLVQGNDFFAATLTINPDDPLEGASDEHPIFLPHTVTCAEFDVFLWFGIK